MARYDAFLERRPAFSEAARRELGEICIGMCREAGGIRVWVPF